MIELAQAKILFRNTVEGHEDGRNPLDLLIAGQPATDLDKRIGLARVEIKDLAGRSMRADEMYNKNLKGSGSPGSNPAGLSPDTIMSVRRSQEFDEKMKEAEPIIAVYRAVVRRRKRLARPLQFGATALSVLALSGGLAGYQAVKLEGAKGQSKHEQLRNNTNEDVSVGEAAIWGGSVGLLFGGVFSFSTLGTKYLAKAGAKLKVRKASK